MVLKCAACLLKDLEAQKLATEKLVNNLEGQRKDVEQEKQAVSQHLEDMKADNNRLKRQLVFLQLSQQFLPIGLKHKAGATCRPSKLKLQAYIEAEHSNRLESTQCFLLAFVPLLCSPVQAVQCYMGSYTLYI